MVKRLLTRLHNALEGYLTNGIFQARRQGEVDIRKEAVAKSYTHTFGGITHADFHTPRPWLYETTMFRKVLWRVCCFLGKLVGKKTHFLPLKADDYKKGKLVVYHSGIRIEEMVSGELTTCGQAYFDPYAGRGH